MESVREKSRAGPWLLIDDDRAFCLIMASAAAERDIKLDTFAALEDIGSIGLLAQYQVAIVDYHLQNWKGHEIAEYFPVFFNETPILLISNQETLKTATQWPRSIKAFTSKSGGATPILEAAAELVAGKSTI